MRFQELLDGVETSAVIGDADVSGVEYDSRQVHPGDIFVAMRGEVSDGNRYIDQAIAAGAVAVVTDSASEKARSEVAWAQVMHGRRALARLSANWLGHPAEQIAITGITGTNGKSTTAFLLDSILAAAKRKSALLGTIEYRIAGRRLPAQHTTPESLELNRILADAVSQGATEAVMEASSHALAQERVFGVPFDVGIFTNLTRDHLDFHHTLAEYFAAKAKLFDGIGTEPPRVAVINQDDEYGRQLLAKAREKSAETWTYGLEGADFSAKNVSVGEEGTRFDMIGPNGELPLFSPLIGKVNVFNILAAAAGAFARGCSFQEIACGVAALDHVPGRFERVRGSQPFTVVVDYAHTDDALRNLTMLGREYVQRGSKAGRVITVFGCGGDRDRNKRPLMAKAAASNSDWLVLTSDNPRSEDPLAIIADAAAGLANSSVNHTVEPDRRSAIALAIRRAEPGDIVLIAGKGHEKVQVTRDGSLPFDDAEVARQALVEAGFEPRQDASVGGKPCG